MKRILLAVGIILFLPLASNTAGVNGNWGFYAHKLINRLAVFSLPEPLFPFYRLHIFTITQWAVNADKRRYVVEDEGPMHFLDMNAYSAEVLDRWRNDVRYFDSIPQHIWREHGAVPQQIQRRSYQLTQAFMRHDTQEILTLSADIGHYIGDAHVPLHTTSNYDGQETGQTGVHGLWESRLPELFVEQYDLFGHQAQYVDDISKRIWDALEKSSRCVDSVLTIEYDLESEFNTHVKSHDIRGVRLQHQFSREFSNKYHRRLSGMVERRLRASIALTADVWYTCWVNAGQPDLQPFDSRQMPDDSISPGRIEHPRNRVH